MLRILIILLVFLFPILAFSQNQRLVIGCYSTKLADTFNDDLYLLEYDEKNIDFKILDKTYSGNPSFLNLSRSNKFLYTVNEENDTLKYKLNGGISLYSIENDKFNFINRKSSEGEHPCHITNFNDKFLYLSNYTGGNLVGYNIQSNQIGGVIENKKFFGSSINTKRQNKSHIHQAYLFKNKLFVSDLGTDSIHCIEIDLFTGALTNLFSTKAIAGSGPRHLVVSKNGKYAYSLEELTGSISVYKLSKNKFNLVQRISTHPQNYKGKIGSADIHISPDGKYLLASNRGESNSIASFKIHKKGKLNLLSIDSCFGQTPRNFSFSPSGKTVLVANQNSNDISVFAFNERTGKLSFIKKFLLMNKPVCITWFN